jgi:hypothetical protein
MMFLAILCGGEQIRPIDNAQSTIVRMIYHYNRHVSYSMVRT